MPDSDRMTATEFAASMQAANTTAGYMRVNSPCPTCGHCPTCGVWKPQTTTGVFSQYTTTGTTPFTGAR